LTKDPAFKDKLVAFRQLRRRPSECLSEHLEEIEDETCKAWVTAEQSCWKAAKENGKCSDKQDVRQCFRGIDKETLGDACVNSDFYKSIAQPNMLGRPKREGRPE
jgi:hypothetical protein